MIEEKEVREEKEVNEEKEVREEEKEENENEILTYLLRPHIEVIKLVLKTNLFSENIKRNDALRLLDEDSFAIKMTRKKYKQLGEWIDNIPSVKRDIHDKLFLLFSYRIFLAMKLNIDPKHFDFVGIAHLDKPLNTIGNDGESRHVFFIMHPRELRDYNGFIRLEKNQITYLKNSQEKDMIPFVIVFSAPTPEQVKYNIGEYPCYIF